jgi:hypothetical protein
VLTLRWRLALDTVDTPSQHWPDPVVAGDIPGDRGPGHGDGGVSR